MAAVLIDAVKSDRGRLTTAAYSELYHHAFHIHQLRRLNYQREFKCWEAFASDVPTIIRRARLTEQKRLEALEAEIAEVETQREERRTRYAVLREYLDGLEAATEAERRELSAQRCAQLRNRTGSNYDANLAVNECVLCFAEPCDQIATPCNHVIGCEACVVKHRNAIGPKCPICLEPATFEKMHFP